MAAKLITEADVRRAPEGRPIVVDADTIITPSARDLAAARGIAVICRRSCGADRGEPAAAPAAALPLLHLADGQYLVHVNRGHVQVFRLTAGGPVPLEP